MSGLRMWRELANVSRRRARGMGRRVVMKGFSSTGSCFVNVNTLNLFFTSLQ